MCGGFCRSLMGLANYIEVFSKALWNDIPEAMKVYVLL